MTTPLDALVDALASAGAYNLAAEAPPEAVIWCDERQDFAPLLPALRARLPHLLTLGTYDPVTRTGPAVWLRAAIASGILGLAWPAGTIPILCLPGVGRETLRAAEDCPTDLVPLAWLAVAGTFFGHVNSKDWTLGGFLGAERGPLKLSVPQDGATRVALGQAAVELFAQPVESLRNRRIDEPFLLDLIMPEPAADMLRWMEHRLDPARLPALTKWAKTTLKFDPAKQDRTDAAALFARREGAWADVWSRFAANPGFHEPLIALLQPLSPDLGDDPSAYPKVNETRESELRGALAKVAGLAPTDARAAVAKLEASHAWRRETIWARMGKAPLATALRYLAIVGKANPLPMHDAIELAGEYAAGGWRVDAAAMDALAAAPREEDRKAVGAALRAVYKPWLDEAATALQKLAKQVDFAGKPKPGKADTVLFVDGLRMDIAHRLVALLSDAGAVADLTWRWSGFPTVTATCKPLASPVASAFTGSDPAQGFQAQSAEGKLVAQPVLKKALEGAGWTTEAQLLPGGKFWTEAGTFDGDGHKLGVRMVDTMGQALRDLADRALALAHTGRTVRIVTDHGWLLLPGGLETAKIEAGLLEPSAKWSRCAVVKPWATVSVPQFRWTWNSNTWVATAPGISAFFAGMDYAHGGISPQESVVPDILLQPLAVASGPVIVETNWKQMRLHVRVDHGAGLRVDLREGSASGPSLVPATKDVELDGAVSLLAGFDHAGKDAVLVVLDAAGTAVARKAVKVPE